MWSELASDRSVLLMHVFDVEDEADLLDELETALITADVGVGATTALVDMIEASRSWDTQLKLVSDARDMDSATANLMALPR